MKFITKRRVAAVALCLLTLGVTACNQGANSNSKASHTMDRIQSRYLQNQPIPEKPYSQLRQNLIEIESAQMDTTQTTSFMFPRGGGGNAEAPAPIAQCPSIGFPIPTTAQLSNPETRVPNHDSVVKQIEPNGIFTGDSSGTFVVCVNASGTAYPLYGEGDVVTIPGAARWNPTTHQIELVGKPTLSFSKSASGK